MLSMHCALRGHLIKDVEQIRQRLFADNGIGRIRSDCIQCPIDRFVDNMPVLGCTRFQVVLCVIPVHFENLDAGLGTHQVILLDERSNICRTFPETTQVSQF